MPDLDYGRIMRRVAWLMAALAGVGAAVFFAVGGVGGGMSFLGGAAISSLSLWLLHRMVRDVSQAAAGGRAKGGSMVVHAFRLIILGGAAYGIVGIYGASGRALVCGLLLAVTAATLEVLLELIYAPH